MGQYPELRVEAIAATRVPGPGRGPSRGQSKGSPPKVPVAPEEAELGLSERRRRADRDSALAPHSPAAQQERRPARSDSTGPSRGVEENRVRRHGVLRKAEAGHRENPSHLKVSASAPKGDRQRPSGRREGFPLTKTGKEEAQSRDSGRLR